MTPARKFGAGCRIITDKGSKLVILAATFAEPLWPRQRRSFLLRLNRCSSGFPLEPELPAPFPLGSDHALD